MNKLTISVKLVILCTIILVLGFFIYRVLSVQKSDSSTRTLFTTVFSTPTPTPTPIPFKELTIPYLRDREYESTLGELRQISANGNYTSYIVTYNSDGLNINGLLTIPEKETPENGWPAIVFVHGYIPPSLYRTTEKYESYIDYFARNGFVVFKTDLRGHGDSEGIASGAYYSGDYVIDTLNAVAALKSAEFVNPNAIGLWGHSMAGNITFRALIADQNIKALVIWAGAVYTYEDFSEFRIEDTSYRPPTDNTARQRYRDELFATHGNFNAESEFWKMVVPTNYLDGVTGALQIHHATDDTVVDVEYSRNLLDVVAGSSLNTTLYEYTSGGHNITGSSFSQAMQRSVEFYKKELQ